MNDKLNYTEMYYVEEYGTNGIYFQFTPDPIDGFTFEEIAQVFKNTYIASFSVHWNEEKERYDGFLFKEDDFRLSVSNNETYEWITGEIVIMREDPELIEYMATRNVSGSVWVRDIDQESQSVIFCTRILRWNEMSA